MAAGLGSRYGGLKQMDPMGNNGEVILDFSVYDAMRAGFEETVFIIKRENQKDFSSLISRGIGKKMKARYVYQELTHLPEGYQLPEGREKPWGTAHAVLCAREAVGDAPFAVINATITTGRKPLKRCTLIFPLPKTTGSTGMPW